MTENHSSMGEKRNSAVIVTGVFAGIWAINVLDALLFFPNEYKGSRLSFELHPQQLAGKNGATTKLSWSF